MGGSVVRSNNVLRATIYQPQYFPRLHYMHRVFMSDICIILDSAQYVRTLVHEGPPRGRHKSYQAHTPIKTSTGENIITIPVHDARQPINETTIDYKQPWVGKHIAQIRSAYGRAPFFDRYFPDVQYILQQRHASLADLTTTTIMWAIAAVHEIPLHVGDLSVENLDTHLKNQGGSRLQSVVRDQATGVRRPDGKQKGTEWTLALCQAVGAGEYVYGGTAANSYMNMEYYIQHGVTPVQQQWLIPEYSQLFSDRVPFIPNLSILDMLFNIGAQQAAEILGVRQRQAVH